MQRPMVEAYYNGTGKFPMGTERGSEGNCVITKWKEMRDGIPWTEIQFDNGRFVTMPHEQIIQLLSKPVVDYNECIREFHTKFEVPVRDEPCIPSLKDCLRRIRLMMEELGEVVTAIDNGDLIEVLDGMADLLVVTFGTCVEFGLPIDQAFLRVHRNNMAKIWPDGTVHKDAGGKVIKPPNFKPVDLSPLLPSVKQEPQFAFGEGGEGQ